MTKKSLEGMRTEERRGAGGETRRDAEEEKDERAREGMGEGGELKKVGANTERGRQQKTIAGLSQAILSMLNWDAVRGKRRTRAQQKGRVTPFGKPTRDPNQPPAGTTQHGLEPDPQAVRKVGVPKHNRPSAMLWEGWNWLMGTFRTGSPFEKPTRPTHGTAKARRTVISRRWRRFRRGRL